MSADPVALDPDQRADVTSTIERVMRRAEYTAVSVGEFLRSCVEELGWAAPDRWPPGFLLGLAAVIELREWQVAGLSPNGLNDCDPWESYLEDLLLGYSTPESEPLRERLAALQQTVFRVWHLEAADESMAHFGVPFLSKPGDHEVLLDALATFLWEFRHLGKTGS